MINLRFYMNVYDEITSSMEEKINEGDITYSFKSRFVIYINRERICEMYNSIIWMKRCFHLYITGHV